MSCTGAKRRLEKGLFSIPGAIPEAISEAIPDAIPEAIPMTIPEAIPAVQEPPEVRKIPAGNIQ